jgi:acyl-CoA thioesterase
MGTTSQTLSPSPILPLLEPVDGGLLATFAESGRSWIGMHGGLVVATLTEAAAQATGRVPVAVTAHLHRAVEPGQAAVTVTSASAGRTVTSATAMLDQGRRRATASVVLVADAEAGDEVTHWPAGRRDLSGLPSPDAVERLAGFEDAVPFAGSVDIRPVADSRPFGGGDRPVLTAWVRLLSAPADRPAVPLVLLDALAPSLYAVRTTPVPIPTVEYTVHLTPVRPTDEWFLIEQRTTWSTDSFCIDEADLLTPDGRLVASSRQLRRILSMPA